MAFHVALSKLNFGMTNYRHPDRAEALTSVTRARSLAYTATTPLECVELRNAVRAVSKVPGEMAEVGVYLGGTAALILDAMPERHLHLFDTFSGLPDGGDYLQQGEYAGSKESVERTLSAYKDRVTFHPGLFPSDTGHEVEDLRFSFVHLDMDLVRSTTDALDFFHPRLVQGGILIGDDYQDAGVRGAFADFFADRGESLIGLPWGQVMVVKQEV